MKHLDVNLQCKTSPDIIISITGIDFYRQKKSNQASTGPQIASPQRLIGPHRDCSWPDEAYRHQPPERPQKNASNIKSRHLTGLSVPLRYYPRISEPVRGCIAAERERESYRVRRLFVVSVNLQGNDLEFRLGLMLLCC
jgi:hypothetical protein